ncbi:hypothetical protein V6N13_051344 [Hibiscus sabdariffa]
MCKCRSHGTFPLFGLQSSHLNICYYHQDLHRQPLCLGSCPGFYGDRRALLLIGAWPLPRRPGIGHALKCHPFSGLVDSAGRGRCGPDASNHWLYPIELAKGSSYPKGNFRGNQLLDGSISLSPLYPSQTNDLHVSIAAGLHQSFLWLRPCSGIVHNLSGPNRHGLTQILLRRSRSVGGAPVDSHTCQTPWFGFQDGPNGEPVGRRPEHASAEARRNGACWVPRSRRRRLHWRIKGPGLGRYHHLHRSTPRADRQTGSRRSTSDRGTSPAPIRFPPNNFKHSLTLFSKSFPSFHPVFSLGRNLPPDWGCIPKQRES